VTEPIVKCVCLTKARAITNPTAGGRPHEKSIFDTHYLFDHDLLCVRYRAGPSQKRRARQVRRRQTRRQAQRITFKPSTENTRWSMVMPWSKGLLFYDIASHMADSIRLASAGRLNIRVYAAEELVPAMQSFDAVSVGTAEVGHDWPGYWKGKNEAFNAFASVPFGLDGEGYNIWLYEKGGLEMMQELYGRYNLYALPAGQLGQEMGLSSNKRATRMEDFKGMRVRTVGWYMDILNNLGASVSPLPGGEIFLALERGVLDAAEFSSPAINYPLGWQDITKVFHSARRASTRYSVRRFFQYGCLEKTS
jgi:TRAP-type mannitol/chloroaromatic compound transport system substrate-binding protein